jgi:hypothetical protein
MTGPYDIPSLRLSRACIGLTCFLSSALYEQEGETLQALADASSARHADGAPDADTR